MEQKKDFLDELEQNLMLWMIIIATVCTLITFVLQFVAPGAVDLFKQLSFYAYGWMVFLGLGPTVKRNSFMRIELLTGKYPEGLRKGLKILCEIVMFAIMLVLCVFSFQLAANTLASGEANATVPAIPLILAYAAPAVGYTLAVVAYIRRTLAEKKGGADK